MNFLDKASLEMYAGQLQDLWSSDARKRFVSLRNPLDVWQENPTLLMCEVIFYVFTLLTFEHARKRGGRHLHLWFCGLLHGLVVENLSYFLPEIDNFWHAHSSIMLSGQRLPLHMLLYYPCIHYVTNIAASKLKLHPLIEPFAVAVSDVIVDIPFDIMGVKLLWWVWHDDDPNVMERSYDVPLTSYMFHLTFALSFTFLLNLSHLLLTGTADREKYSSNWFSEFVCLVLTGCLSMPVAAFALFIPFYHIPHDLFGVSTKVCVCVFAGLCVMIMWCSDRDNPTGKPNRGNQVGGRTRRHGNMNGVALVILIHFAFYGMLVALVSSPQAITSTGVHQTIGDCQHTTYVSNVLGMQVPRKTYLCPTNYQEPYFSLNCSSFFAAATGEKGSHFNKKLTSLSYSPPVNGSSLYTICGTPYDNHAEYQVVVIAAGLLGLAFFWQLLFRSSGAPQQHGNVKQHTAGGSTSMTSSQSTKASTQKLKKS